MFPLVSETCAIGEDQYRMARTMELPRIEHVQYCVEEADLWTIPPSNCQLLTLALSAALSGP